MISLWNRHGPEKKKAQFVKAMVQLQLGRAGSVSKALATATLDLKAVEQGLRRVPKTDSEKMARGRLLTQHMRLKGRIAHLEEQVPATKDALQQKYDLLYDDILKIPRVLCVRVDLIPKPVMVLHTDVLYGRCSGLKWHRIGPFQISVELIDPVRKDAFPLGAGEIRSIVWINLDGPRLSLAGPANTEEYWMSPMYINKQGHAVCFGSDRAWLASLLQAEDWLSVANVIVRYPECPGQQNAIMQWPVVEKSEVPSWYLETFA